MSTHLNVYLLFSRASSFLVTAVLPHFSIPTGSITIYVSIKGICREQSEHVMSVICCARIFSYKLHFKCYVSPHYSTPRNI